MDAIDIIYRLRRLGKNQAQIARELGVSGGVVNNVIHDRITAHAVASYIARLIGCTVAEIWPNRYIFKARGTVAKQCIAQMSHDKGETL